MRTPDNPISRSAARKPTTRPRKRRMKRDGRRQLGMTLIANALARGLAAVEALEHVRAQDVLLDAKGKRPSLRTLWHWYGEVDHSHLDLTTDVPADTRSVDEHRESLAGEYSQGIIRWRYLRAPLLAALDSAADDEERRKIRVDIARCEDEVREYADKLVKVWHLDKLAPMERLDDEQIRGQLLQHVQQSLGKFEPDELDAWIDALLAAKERRQVVFEVEGEVAEDELEDVGIS
jgi:hypothetical protein